jgi:Zn-dependent protease
MLWNMERVQRRGTWTIVRLPVGPSGERVPLRVHWSLLVALPWLAAQFLLPIAAGGRAPRVEAYVLALALAIGLFIGVALHELSHTAVGIRLGGAVRAITLMFLGGVSEMSRPPPTPAGEVAMAVAGPAASLAIAGASWGVARLLHGLGATALGLFAEVNLAIAVFNLVPAFPLDGGRVLRGLLALRLGEARATHAAVAVGRVLAVVLGALGVLAGNPFLVLIAVLVFFAGPMEERATTFAARLDRVPVWRLMEPYAATLPPNASVAEAWARLAAGPGTIFVEREGRVVGQVRAEDAQAVPYVYRARTPVESVMAPLPAPVAPADSAGLAARRMTELSVDELPVVEAGHLAGLLRRATLERFAAAQPVA